MVILQRIPVALALSTQLILCAWLSNEPAQARIEHQAPSHAAAPITVSEEHISGVCYQVSRVLIKATPADVWQVLTDYSNAANVFPTLKQCQVLVDKGNTKLIRYVIRPSGVITSFVYDLEIKEQANRFMEWHRIGGDFKAVEGFWKLEPMECGRATLVTHATYVNGGFLMPQALIKHQSHVDLPQVMAALKDRAERTMQIASHGSHAVN